MIYDVAIIGAGMAGASLAAHLGADVSTVLLEAEEQPGYHSTGRSAAFYTETYGGPNVQPLTTASKDWYFSTRSHANGALMVKKRGALHVNWTLPDAQLERFYEALRPLSPDLQLLTSRSCADICNILTAGDISGGVYDPDCCDIDVASVHQHFLRLAKANSVALKCCFRVSRMAQGGGHWVLKSANGDKVEAKVVVNAAGAWADDVAHLAGTVPLGLTPKRRTIGIFDLKDAKVQPEWPLVLDLSERFYFKPEGAQVLISPADETPSQACDAQPEIEDVARAAHRFEKAIGVALGHCRAKWAGLRTFAPDRSPVYGFDDQVPGFFWCAGQGGFGIQTAPAAGALCAALLRGERLPLAHEACGITVDRYAPQRFLSAA